MKTAGDLLFSGDWLEDRQEDEEVYVATTIYGLEDVAAREIEALCKNDVSPLSPPPAGENATGRDDERDERGDGSDKRVLYGHGKVFFRGKKNILYRVAMASKTINRAGVLLSAGRFRSLGDLVDIIKRDVEPEKYLGKKQSFEVRFKRFGNHNFTSMDANAAVGEIFHSMGYRVDLTTPDVTLRGWVHDNRFFFSIDATGPLYNRHYRVCKHPAPIRPNLASLLVFLSGWPGVFEKNPADSGVLLDPFCGSGTILVEAWWAVERRPPNLMSHFRFENMVFHDPEVFENERAFLQNTWVEHREKLLDILGGSDVPVVVGIEKYKRHVDCCLKTLGAGDVPGTCFLGDGARFDEYVAPEKIGGVVTNPPYGLRIGSKKTSLPLHHRFIERIKRIKHSGLNVPLVMITPHRVVEKHLTGLPIERRRVAYGGLWVNVYRVDL